MISGSVAFSRASVRSAAALFPYGLRCRSGEEQDGHADQHPELNEGADGGGAAGARDELDQEVPGVHGQAGAEGPEDEGHPIEGERDEGPGQGDAVAAQGVAGEQRGHEGEQHKQVRQPQGGGQKGAQPEKERQMRDQVDGDHDQEELAHGSTLAAGAGFGQNFCLRFFPCCASGFAVMMRACRTGSSNWRT
jgi:hypothetical protein